MLRESKGEGEGERERGEIIAFYMCSDHELNWQPFHAQDDAQPIESLQPGL